LVIGLYRAFEFTLRGFPILSARAWATIAIALWLWPVVFILLGTSLGIAGRPFRALAVLTQSRPLSAAEGQTHLPSDIQVRAVDLDGAPDAKPMSLLRGWRQYVIVSEVLVEELDAEEFEAVLRHEEYHLQESNRALLLEALSPIVGGKNALLAFYDYRESERAADDRAVEYVGHKATYRAVEKMYNLAATANTAPNRIRIHHPGIVRREEISERVNDLNAVAKIRRLLRYPIATLNAPYQLYFGAVLLETAHLDAEARLNRLNQKVHGA
jgi:Zn-dependent protease with chaperone function